MNISDLFDLALEGYNLVIHQRLTQIELMRNSKIVETEAETGPLLDQKGGEKRVKTEGWCSFHILHWHALDY